MAILYGACIGNLTTLSLPTEKSLDSFSTSYNVEHTYFWSHPDQLICFLFAIGTLHCKKQVYNHPEFLGSPNSILTTRQ